MIAIYGAICGLVLVIFVAVIVTKHDILARFYDARISEKGIKFLLLSRTFCTITFENIHYVTEVRGGYQYPFALNFKNRFFRGCLFIRKKRGFFTRQVLITPADPEAFIKRLMEAGVQVQRRNIQQSASPTKEHDGHHQILR